jgi:hypothetical protein
MMDQNQIDELYDDKKHVVQKSKSIFDRLGTKMID